MRKYLKGLTLIHIMIGAATSVLGVASLAVWRHTALLITVATNLSPLSSFQIARVGKTAKLQKDSFRESLPIFIVRHSSLFGQNLLENIAMNSVILRRVFRQTYRAVLRNHTLHMAAALSYYLALSLFPALILLSAIVAYLPVPNLFEQVLGFMAHFLPSDSMGLVGRVLKDVVTPDAKVAFSFGTLGTLWATSRGFAAAIEALSMAYDVRDDRPFWKTTLLALGLALTTGLLLVIALFVMVVGPSFGDWIAGMLHLSRFFVLLWPYARWTTAVGFAVMAIEILYVYAPNAKQRFRDTLPGAVFAVACWFVLSRILEEYFAHFASFNKTYGTLGAAIALMVWLYWTGFAILLGAELNAELARVIEQEPSPPLVFTKQDSAA